MFRSYSTSPTSLPSLFLTNTTPPTRNQRAVTEDSRAKMYRRTTIATLRQGRRVCIAIKDEEDGNVVARWALDNVLQQEDEVVLLHVRPRSKFSNIAGNDYVLASTLMQMDNLVRLQSHALLRQYAVFFHEQGYRVRCIALRGKVAPEVVLKSEFLHANILVVGAHKHGLLRKFWRDSVKFYCERYGSVPVMAVPLGRRLGNNRDGGVEKAVDIKGKPREVAK